MLNPLVVCRVVLVVCGIVTLVAAQVPNGGFETWVADSAPGWFSINVEKSTDAHSGSFAVHGIVDSTYGKICTEVYSAWPSGFAWNQKSTKFSFYYKCSLQPDDFFLAYATLQSGNPNGSLMAMGMYQSKESVNSYRLIEIPISYYDASAVPIRAIIVFGIFDSTVSGNAHVGSSFFVDDATLTGGTSILTRKAAFSNQFQFVHTIFNSQAVASFALVEPAIIHLSVFNPQGLLVKTLINSSQQAGPHTIGWGSLGLGSGFYLYRFESVSTNCQKQSFSFPFAVR